MSIKAKITQTNTIRATVTGQQELVAQTVKVGGVALTDLSNVDAANLADGALLVYNAETEKFELTNELSSENLTISAGLF
jgi:hypothetical protein